MAYVDKILQLTLDTEKSVSKSALSNFQKVLQNTGTSIKLLHKLPYITEVNIIKP
jgi:hypothetical protein